MNLMNLFFLIGPNIIDLKGIETNLSRNQIQPNLTELNAQFLPFLSSFLSIKERVE